MRFLATVLRFPRTLSRRALVIAAAGALLLSGAAAAAATVLPRQPMLPRQVIPGAAAPAAAKAAAAPYTFVHDPAMAEEDGTYYTFSTGDPAGTIGNGNIQIRTSRDLRHWTYAGTVFADKPSWITNALGDIPNLWAPDISYFGGLWHLYYAGSSFGSNNSVIGLATTPVLDPSSPRYHWNDDGLVFRSVSSDDYNAIDPSLVTAADGAKRLSFGSFWSGIQRIALDAATGKPAASPPTVYPLAEKAAPDPEEGSGIVYHGGYYYLFVAVDTCCRGVSSTYHIQVGRSASITGPYTDASGTAMTDGGGMEVQGTDEGMIGPGSPFVFTAAGGRPWLVYHYYDAFDSGDAWIQIRPLTWVDGWPVTGSPLVPVPGEGNGSLYGTDNGGSPAVSSWGRRLPEGPSFLFRRAAPYPVRLVRRQGELQALPAHRALRADRLGPRDVPFPWPVRRDREEDVRIGAVAGRGPPPVSPCGALGALAEQFGDNHQQTPRNSLVSL